MSDLKFSFTCVMVEDPKLGGYTAFFKQIPNIIAEGESSDEAFENLMNALHDVFQYQKDKEVENFGTEFNIQQTDVNLTSLEVCN